MSDYTVKRIAEMETSYHGGFVKARAELGVTAFGVQIIQLPGDFNDYPEHDHISDGQEEVFLAIDGSGWLEIDGERVDLTPETFIRVGPQAKRKVISGPEGVRVLALGGAPGEVYKAPLSSELTGA